MVNMIFAVRLDLDSVKIIQHLGQRSFSFKSYCIDTQTTTTDRLLYLDHLSGRQYSSYVAGCSMQ